MVCSRVFLVFKNTKNTRTNNCFEEWGVLGRQPNMHIKEEDVVVKQSSRTIVGGNSIQHAVHVCAHNQAKHIIIIIK